MEEAITGIPGILIGNADNPVLITGVTAIVFETPAVASVSVLGGAPAGRDLGCLDPGAVVPAVDAIVLSGGSGFGLDAAGGVQAWLRERGRGFKVGHHHVPIVPSAILFDLTNGGDKNWGRYSPYRELGYAAAAAACAAAPVLGTCGAGYGASTVDLKGGLGAATATTSRGFRVGAIVAVNALGSALSGRGPHFLAGHLERDGEFGGLGPGPGPGGQVPFTHDWKGRVAQVASPAASATTIACLLTDARLDKGAATRLARAGNAGLARGLSLTHATMDGDTVFAAATGRNAAEPGIHDEIEIAALAADCLARAIAVGVHRATVPPPTGRAAWAGPPAWRDVFGKA